MKDLKQKLQENQSLADDIVQDYEEKRKKSSLIVKVSIILALIFFFSPILLIILCANIPNFCGGHEGFVLFSPIIFLILTAISALVADQTQKNYENNIKSDFYDKISKIFRGFTWYQCKGCSASKAGLPDYLLEESALFGGFNKRSIDDEFQGRYKGVGYKISETTMWFESESKKLMGSLIFKGIIIQFDSNKNANGMTMVSTKGDMTQKNNFLLAIIVALPIILPAIACPFMLTISDFKNNTVNFFDFFVTIFPPLLIGILFSSLIYFMYFDKKERLPLNKIELEDPIFNKRFDVFSSDEIEARYFVTPSFMERLNNLKTVFGTNRIKCSFFRKKLLIAISTTKNFFEIGSINTPLESHKIMDKFYREIGAIHEMIDYFKLDEETRL